MAHQRLAHSEAEVATARAAQATGSCLVASTLSSCTLEDIAAASGPARWFQLYLQPQREHSLDLLHRAENAGYRAIVLTLDASIQLASRSALQAGFAMPPDCVPANLARYPQPAPAQPAAGESRIFQGAMRHAPRWDDLRWLLASTRLPVWIKGVLHPDDARELQAAGAAGLIVSNHGGPPLARAPPPPPVLRPPPPPPGGRPPPPPPTRGGPSRAGRPHSLRMLPALRAAVGAGYPLLLDGGVRSGQDAFKALALGADAVLVGRLQVYALAVAGALGVAHMLQMLAEELHACMAQAGCAQLSDITHDTLTPSC